MSQRWHLPQKPRVLHTCADIVSRAEWRLIEIAREVFHHVDEQIEVEIELPDGSDALPGDTLLTVNGRVASILTAERTALNFLQRLCGVASLTNKFVGAANRPEMALLDTRKTMPGWRALDCTYALPCAVVVAPTIEWGSMMRL